MRQRMVSKAGREWAEALARYANVKDGPMHYPTHSTSGPISVMGAHAARVSAWPFPNALSSVEPEDGEEIWNETGLFLMSNGATMRIIEYRQIGHTEREIFRIYGTDGSFENDTWVTCRTQMPLSIDEMRDPLPPEVEAAFRRASGRPDFGGAWTADAMRRVAEALAGDRMSLEQAWQAAPAMMAAAMANQSVHSNAEAVPPTRERLLETFDHLLDELTFYGGHGGSHAYLVHEFVDAVAHDRVPAINVWEAVRYMAAGVMAHQSALRDGEMLEVPDWGDAPSEA